MADDTTKPKNAFKSEASNLHSDHRDRMYKRFLTSLSLDGFAPHEVIEMLLYRSIPMRNTSETAHRLIEKFGGLLEIFRAAPTELKSVKGMTARAALDLAVMYRAFLLLPPPAAPAAQVMDSTQSVLGFVRNRMKYEDYELVYIMCLDAANRVINVDMKTEYMPQSVALNARTIVKTAMSRGASKVILVHNHPSGDPTPSAEDDAVTRDSCVALAALEIALLDHIIIAKDKFYSYNQTDFILHALTGAKYEKLRGHLSLYIRRDKVML
ncbi:MAG: hypothetical protein LBL66_09200 [Clostridiales bacterium]|jgi:DNA repair protein RadC|nr:hypothetical protein [Clostridiales bacterium]